MIFIEFASQMNNIYNLIVASYDKSVLDKNSGVLVDLRTNWESNGYVDFQVQAALPCATGYSTIVDDYWPGTDPACDCRNKTVYLYSTSLTGNLYNTTTVLTSLSNRTNYYACDTNMTNAGCADVAARPAVTL